MKAQQEIVTLFFPRSTLVRVNLGQEIITAQVEAECNGRPGWYYVRECASGELHLVMWSDLQLARVPQGGIQ